MLTQKMPIICTGHHRRRSSVDQCGGNRVMFGEVARQRALFFTIDSNNQLHFFEIKMTASFLQ